MLFAKRFALTGCALLVVLTTQSGCVVHRNKAAMTNAYAMDRESKAYYQQVIPGIVKTWSSEDLLKVSSPQLLNQAPVQKVQDYVAKLSRTLGPLKELQSPVGQAKVEEVDHRSYTTAAYKAQAAFEKGDGTVNVRLIKQNGKWQVLFFAVDTDAT